MSSPNESAEDAVVIRKYPNRRLYNTETSVYVTLDDLANLVKEGRDFVVHDAKTGEDLTRQVLTQIIFERELQSSAMLPTSFLRSLIGFYDSSMGGPLQHYLDASMKTFLSNQEKIRGYATRTIGDFSPFSQLEELARQNVSFFEKTMTAFNPFGNLFGVEEPKRNDAERKKKK